MLMTFLRRVGLYALTLLLASMLVFVATEVLPGDALEVSLTADEIAMMNPEDLARKRHDLGLDRPAPVRYFEWLTGAMRGDFGKTILGGTPVVEIIREPVKNSLLLAAMTALVAIPVSLLLGIVAAFWRGRLPDTLASMGAVLSLIHI